MFEQVVTTLLNRVLGDYVDNLQTEQLNIGIWRGDVVLKNLRLRRDALDKFDLPVDVVEADDFAGYIGDLTLKIPWKNLKGQPFRIFIDNIFLVAAPKSSSEYNAEEEQERDFKLKQERLATLDIIQTPAASEVEESANSTSFTAQLLTKVIDNLQISINNIHVRYEDFCSNAKRTFSVGITLHSLSIVSADENWVESFIDIAANHTRKIVKLESLSVYWLDDAHTALQGDLADTMAQLKNLIPLDESDPNFKDAFILSPVNGIGKLTINRKYGGEVPKYQAQLEFDNFSFFINDRQYHDLWLLLHYFETYNKSKKYRALRPARTLAIRDAPRAYWRFAIDAALMDVRQRLRPYTKQYLTERRQKRLAYMRLYKENRNGHMVQGTPSALELEALERELSIEDLRFFRSLANKELRKERLVEAKLASQAPKPVAAARSWGSWLWGGAASHTAAKEDQGTFTEQDLKTLYETIDYNDGTAEQEHAMPPDCVLFQVSWKLRHGAFHIRRFGDDGNYAQTTQAMQAARLVFQDMSLNAMQHLSKTLVVGMGVGELTMWDGFTANTLYPTIAKTKSSNSAVDDGGESKGPLFELQYISEPPGSQLNSSVNIKSRSLEVVYNPYVINALTSFFSPPEDVNNAAIAVANVARNTLEDLKAQTRAGLEFALAEHKSLDVSITIDAPVFVFPHSCTDATSTIVVVDSGHALIKSDLLDSDKKREIEAKQGTQLDEEDLNVLKSLMFDKYKFSLSASQVVVGNSYERCLAALAEEASNELHVLQRTDLNFEVALSILPKAPNVPRMKIDGSLPIMTVNLSDTKYRAVMKTIDLLSSSSSPPSSSSSSADSLSQSPPMSPTLDQASPSSSPSLPGNTIPAEASLAEAVGSPSLGGDLTATLKAAALKTADSGDSINEGDQFFDATENAGAGDAAANASSSSTKAKNQKILMAAARVLIEFNFSITHVRAMLSMSDRGSQSADERTLAVLELRDFGLTFVQKTFERQVQLRLQSLLVEDMLQTYGSNFKHLISSANAEHNDQLVSINYMQVDKASPDFADKYGGIEQSIDVNFNELDLLVTRDTILQLYDFILTTFTDGGNADADRQQPTITAHEDSDEDSLSPAVPEPNSGHMRIKVQVGAVRASLNASGSILATMQFGKSQFELDMNAKGMLVKGSIGDLSVLEPSLRPIFQVQSGQVANFTFTMLSPAMVAAHATEWDSEVVFKVGSVQVAYFPPMVNRILGFLSEFAQMHALVEAARQAAAQSAAQIQQRTNRFHYDVVMESPVVLLPRPNSDDCLQAYPGEIRASNSFVPSGAGGFINSMVVNVSNTRLESKLYFGNEVDTQTIMENVNIEVGIKSREQTSGLPGTEIVANLTDIHLKLTEQQYALTNEFLQTFSAPAPEADDSANAAESTAASSQSLAQASSKAASADSVQAAAPAAVATSTDIHFTVSKIDLELLTSSKQSRKVSSLAYAKAEGLSFQMAMLNNGASEMELSIHKFGIRDTRELTANKFKDILVRSDTPHHQLVMQRSTTSSGSSYMVVALDSPKLVLILDHIFAIKDFFVQPAAGTPLVAAEKDALAVNTTAAPHAPQQRQTATEAPSFRYRINVVDIEMAVIEDPQNEASEALLLSANQLQVWQEASFGAKIDGLSLYLCQMTKRLETAVCFMPNLEISTIYDVRRNAQNFEIHNIITAVKQIVLRISYHDVLVLSNIINNFLALASTSASSSGAPPPPATDSPPTSAGIGKSNSDQSLVSTASSLRKPELIVSTEKLQLSILGIKVVLIDDMNDLHLPMIDMSVGEADISISDWSTGLRVSAPLSLAINYYNVRNSHWEPLVEPWQTQINYRQSASSSTAFIEMMSRKLLNINATQVFLDTLLNTMSKWNAVAGVEPKQRRPRGTQKPYVIRNCTGHKLTLWKDGDSGSKRDPVLRDLEDQQEMPWRFESWKKMRETIISRENKIVVQLHDIPWETIKGIVVDREGATSYFLRPKYQNISHRLVCDVRLKENVKVVTLRSALCLVNKTTMPLEIYVETPGQVQNAFRVVRLEPDQEYYPPVSAIYKARMKIRPEEAFGFNWSSRALFWDDFRTAKTMGFVCTSKTRNTPSFRLQALAEFDDRRMAQEAYPDMKIFLQSPLEIENLLPSNLQFAIKDVQTNEEASGMIRQGDSDAVYSVDLGHTLTLSVKIPELGYYVTEVAIVHDLYHNDVDEHIDVRNRDGHTVRLQLLNVELKDARSVRKITIFCPYLIVNHLNMGVNVRDKERRARAGALGYLVIPQTQEEAKPVMFSYPTRDVSGRRVQLQVDRSEWSKPVSFEAVGSANEAVIISESGVEEMALGVTVTEGPGKLHLTKVITISPRYVLKNDTGEDLQWRQSGSSRYSTLAAGGMERIHFLQISETKQLSFRYPGNIYDWSGPLDMQQVGDVVLRIEKLVDNAVTDDTTSCELVRADVVLDGATLFVIASKTDKWPYLIENLTDFDVRFYQKESRRKEYCVRSGKSSPYTWDNCALPEKTLVLQIGSSIREVNVNELGTLLPWEITHSSASRVLSIDIYAQSSAMVVQINHYTPSRSQYKQVAQSASSSLSSVQANFELIDSASVMRMNVSLRLEGVGISLVDRRMQELAYLTFKGVQLTFRDTNVYQSMSFVVKWIQIDNQRHEALSPIVLYPTVIPNAGQEQENHPAFQTAAVRSKDTSHGVNYFKYFTLLLQELSVDVDEDFLFALLDYLQFIPPTAEAVTEQTWGDVLKSSEPTVNPTSSQMYFELFHLQPIKINVSFSRTKRDTPDNTSASHNPISFLLNVLSMGIANVHDVPIKLNALVLEHPIVSFPVLYQRIYHHYSQEVISQLYKIVGSIDIIGNPVGLFSNIGSGFKDVFYEPYQGFVSDRPQDFALGFAKGAGSLARKTVYGFSDTLSRMTGSVGKGLAIATLDEDFQQTRQISKARNRPKNTLFGVTTGAKSFAKGVVSGVTGVLTKPIEGAENEGVEGFIKGVGKGLVGLVAKPTLGLFDLANNVSEGIKSTTTATDEREIDRMRLPRFVDKSGILTPFSEREALGQFWLMQLENGKYRHETYVAHIDTKVEDFVAILTRASLLMVRLQRLKLDWELSFHDVQGVTFSRERLEVHIALRHHNSGRYQVVTAPDQASGEWFSRELAHAHRSFSDVHRPLE
ncbi:Vacuolar protein sorting-associated protein 13 [Sorochytrium milnesiophthora]